MICGAQTPPDIALAKWSQGRKYLAGVGVDMNTVREFAVDPKTPVNLHNMVVDLEMELGYAQKKINNFFEVDANEFFPRIFYLVYSGDVDRF